MSWCFNYMSWGVFFSSPTYLVLWASCTRMNLSFSENEKFSTLISLKFVYVLAKNSYDILTYAYHEL